MGASGGCREHATATSPGGNALLTKIDQHLKRDKEKPAIQAIVGLGGIGKTQIAAEFAWRHRKDYGVIWWLPADDPTTLALSYAQLASGSGIAKPTRRIWMR